MSLVRMVHPGLSNREIEVPEAAVFGHRAAGWLPAEEAEAAPEQVTEKTPEPPKPAAAPRRTTSPTAGQDKE